MKHQFEDPIQPESLTVELFICASMYGTHEKQTEVIQQVQSLVDAGVVDEFHRYTWARQLSPTADDTWCEFAREKFAEFADWASTRDRSLGPAFSRRSVHNEFVDEEYEVVQFPIISLAVFRDGSLVRLSPSVDADGVAYTVEDCLAELAELEPERPQQRQKTAPEM